MTSDNTHRAALARWVSHLTVARIVRDLDVESMRVENEATGTYALDGGRSVSWRQAWRGIVGAPSRPEAHAWLEAAAGRGPSIAAVRHERRSRAHEVLHRLGVGDPWSFASPVPWSALEAAAQAVLDETADLWRSVLKDARAKETVAQASPVDVIRMALARDAPEGWPARLSPRWLSETFPRLTEGLTLHLGALPERVGASSFARALGMFGRALRIGGVAKGLPFALGQGPMFVDAHRFAAVFAQLAASRAFQRRVLGNGERIADSQSRILWRTLLVAARLESARVLLARAPERFEELTTQVFGAAMPRALTGAWPACRDDESARALALLDFVPLSRELVERFDVDWFKNPRATTFLRSRAAGAAYEPEAALDPKMSARVLSAMFEEALA
jgi:hypothetical protein